MSKPCTWCESKDHTSFYCRRKRNEPIIVKGCKFCGSIAHWPAQCPSNPDRKQRKVIKRSKKKIANGKVALKWEATRQVWFVAHKPPYTCHYCGLYLSKKTVTLDHKESRSRHPELRFEQSNIVPACWNCNTLKGSLPHDEYVHTCHL